MIPVNKNKNNIMVMGDVHGRWEYLNMIIKEYKPDIILQCGDFGFFPNFDDSLKKIKPRNTKIYWVDGNHENHWILKEKYYNKDITEIQENVFYCTRGSMITLKDNRNVLFMGGADSIDKDRRIIGRDWFPDELINQGNIQDSLIHRNKKIDIIISHTCPNYFDIQSKLRLSFSFKDPSRQMLDVLYDEFKPDLWYFGHWHIWTGDTYEDCKWTALDMVNRTGCWEWL